MKITEAVRDPLKALEVVFQGLGLRHQVRSFKDSRDQSTWLGVIDGLVYYKGFGDPVLLSQIEFESQLEDVFTIFPRLRADVKAMQEKERAQREREPEVLDRLRDLLDEIQEEVTSSEDEVSEAWTPEEGWTARLVCETLEDLGSVHDPITGINPDSGESEETTPEELLGRYGALDQVGGVQITFWGGDRGSMKQIAGTFEDMIRDREGARKAW